MAMKRFVGVVRDGAVKLPPGVRLPDGTRVGMMVLEEPKVRVQLPRNPKFEAEDLRFIEACRPHLNRILRDAEKAPQRSRVQNADQRHLRRRRP